MNIEDLINYKATRIQYIVILSYLIIFYDEIIF